MSVFYRIRLAGFGLVFLLAVLSCREAKTPAPAPTPWLPPPVFEHGSRAPQGAGPGPRGGDPRNAATMMLEGFAAARKRNPEDLRALKKIYDEGRLSPYVRGVDAAFGTDLDARVREAIAAGIAGNEPAAKGLLAEQAIRRAYVESFLGGLTRLIDGTGNPDAMNRLMQAAPIVRAVVCESTVEPKVSTDSGRAFDDSMARLKAADDAQNAEDRTRQAETLRQLVRRSLDVPAAKE